MQTIKIVKTQEEERIDKLLMLNDEQKQLLKQFEEAAAKLKKANVLLICNTDEEYYAYNANDIYGYQFSLDGEPYVDEQDKDKWRMADKDLECYKVDFECPQYICDEDLFVQVEK